MTDDEEQEVAKPTIHGYVGSAVNLYHLIADELGDGTPGEEIAAAVAELVKTGDVIKLRRVYSVPAMSSDEFLVKVNALLDEQDG